MRSIVEKSGQKTKSFGNSQIGNKAIVSCTSSVPQNAIGNCPGLHRAQGNNPLLGDLEPRAAKGDRYQRVDRRPLFGRRLILSSVNGN